MNEMLNLNFKIKYIGVLFHKNYRNINPKILCGFDLWFTVKFLQISLNLSQKSRP